MLQKKIKSNTKKTVKKVKLITKKKLVKKLVPKIKPKTVKKKIVKIKKSKPEKKIIKSKVAKKILKNKIIKKISKIKLIKKPIKLKNKIISVKNKIKTKIVKKTINKKKLNKKTAKIGLYRYEQNPILSPTQNFWESEAVFNPGVIYLNNKVHLFYRAMGPDGISRIGYAVSNDGINFERLSYPVFYLSQFENLKKDNFTSPARKFFDPISYASGGGWGGTEDPRVVAIDGIIYITLNIFNGWHSLRVGVISIKEEDLLKQNWDWNSFAYLSHLGDRQKNWVLFPEKINDKFLVFHNLDMNDGDINKVGIAYSDELSTKDMPSHFDAPDPQRLPDRIITWHKRTRSASAPPIKTKDGWLVLYHAMDKDGSDRYKLGAMLLDLKNPRRVLCRAKNPILESKEWYENDYKPGIVYASGAVVLGEDLFVYYGGGDKRVNVATIQLNKLLEGMKKDQDVKLEKIKNKKLI